MSKKSNFKEEFQYATLVIPGVIMFTIGLIIPMIIGGYYSMTDWDGLSFTKNFIGLDNYKRMMTDQYLKEAWIFTAKFTVLNTIFQNVFAIALAVALDSAIKGKKLFRTVFFLPCLISTVVVGYIWLKIYGNILPAIMDIFNLNINVMLFGSKETVLTGLLIANNWQWVGYWMLIYLAALQSIPSSLYEAAKVDGANAITQFKNITIPMLAPAITICVIGITVGSVKVFDLLVSSTAGGPGRASTSIVYYIHNIALSGRQYGYGSALSMSLIAVLLLIAVIQLKVLKGKEVQM